MTTRRRVTSETAELLRKLFTSVDPPEQPPAEVLARRALKAKLTRQRRNREGGDLRAALRLLTGLWSNRP